MPKASNNKKGVKKQKMEDVVEEVPKVKEVKGRRGKAAKNDPEPAEKKDDQMDVVSSTTPLKENESSSQKQITEALPLEISNVIVPPISVKEDAVHESVIKLNEKYHQSINVQFPSIYDASFVNEVYEKELSHLTGSNLQKWQLSRYLEDYLWKYLNKDVPLQHVLSILIVLQDKNLINHPLLEILSIEEGKFSLFWERLIDWYLETSDPTNSFNTTLKTECIRFFRFSYLSLEVKPIRNTVLRYLSLPIWYSLSNHRREIEFENDPILGAAWKRLQLHRENLKKSVEEGQPTGKKGNNKRKRQDEDLLSGWKVFERDSQFFPKLIDQFHFYVQSITSEVDINENLVQFIYRTAEFLSDLLGQYPTRRYLKAYLDDRHFIIHSKQSFLYQSSQRGTFFVKQIALIEEYLFYPVNDKEETLIPYEEFIEANNDALNALQLYAFKHLRPQLDDLIFSSFGQLAQRAHLNKTLQFISKEDLITLVRELKITNEYDEETLLTDSNSSENQIKIIKELIFERFCARPRLLDHFKDISIYPTEKLLWDEFKIPFKNSDNALIILPKLNLHFLSIEDYLYRNLLLYQSESGYQIREDIIEAVKRSAPKKIYNGSILFNGWAQTALPVLSMTIDEVANPKLGEQYPSRVTSTVTIDIARFGKDIRDEWELLKPHDIVFLISFDNPLIELTTEKLDQFEKDKAVLEAGGKLPTLKNSLSEHEIRSFLELYGIKYIRGAEIYEYRDESNTIINETNKGGARSGTKRKLKIELDPLQYQHDLKEGHDCYEKMHLLVRRDPRENNFKAILDTIRNLLITTTIGEALPSWLSKTVLGSGNILSAHYRSIEPYNMEKDNYFDSFIDEDHIKESFPGVEVSVSPSKSKGGASAFFKLEIHRVALAASTADHNSVDRIIVHPYSPRSRGPYPENSILRNNVRFTSRQIQAIRSGMRQGLSLIVGPPGTGKTDVAVQLISNLYHNYPHQKILVITHSNAALNDIFAKIIYKDIHPRHLLRLGSGETDLRDSLSSSGLSEVQSAYGKQGRIDWCLSKRMQILGQVQRLSLSLGQLGDVGSTCETASYFYNLTLLPKIQRFWDELKLLKEQNQPLNIPEKFPFKLFFNDVPQLFADPMNDEVNLKQADSCLNYLYGMFEELSDYQNLEVLRTTNLRHDYIVSRQARVVAMTCTHAAIMKDRLVKLGFKFDSLIVEEAAQILDIETFIPMVLQIPTASSQGVILVNHDSAQHRLKRVVLLGDHYQLPPIIHNQPLQQSTQFDQSLFARLIRLHYPYIQLNLQGRAKADIVSLYSWRYEQSAPATTSSSNNNNSNNNNNSLVQYGSLPYITSSKEFLTANTGFYYSYQFIHVPFFQNQGETSPAPYSYQNLGEAEYIVAVFQYMCLLGYPAEKISILTTYQGQKRLIRQLLYQRCQFHPSSSSLGGKDAKNLFGKPKHITTVDQFQGQQNDYILLSLVRTHSIGYLQDLRRIIVGFSRARYGLYIFGYLPLYEQSPAWFPLLSRLLQRPTKLALIAGESYPTERLQDSVNHTETTDEGLKSRLLEIEDVTTMGILVYQIIQQMQVITRQ